MSEASWLDLAAAAVSGGLVVKVLDVAYEELRRWLDRGRDAKRFVDEHLDPLLKAADEITGKLHVLAQRDFGGLDTPPGTLPTQLSGEIASLTYLLAKFWARIEIFRTQSLYVRISKDKRGKRLLAFLDCLESPRIRILDRTEQQAIAESATGDGSPLSYVAFVEAWEKDERLRHWLQPALEVVARARRTEQRQALLQYGAVIHAMADSLDPRHEVTRDRPGYANKMTTRTIRSLRHRAFGTYLRFVDDPSKYTRRSVSR